MEGGNFLKIAICGAHGTGKSTLADFLAGELGGHVLPTPGRLMAAQALPLNQEATVASQALAWLIQLRLETTTAPWISMRSLLDVWAYAMLAAERHHGSAVERALSDELTAVTRALMPGRYDLLLYLPPRIPLVADDVRSADQSFQTAVDRKMKAALTDWRIPHVELDVSAPDARSRALALASGRPSTAS